MPLERIAPCRNGLTRDRDGQVPRLVANPHAASYTKLSPMVNSKAHLQLISDWDFQGIGRGT